MHQIICLLIFSLALGVAASAQESKHGSGYAGEEGRAIKSLSAEEVEQLLGGQGMGLAKAAELNHYPGPRHVLELGEQLQLTPAQRASAQATFDRMHDAAVRLGREIVARERLLDAMFAKGNISEGELHTETSEIAQLQGMLRAAHLSAHLEMRRLLSPAQIKRYDELRGYAGGAAKQTDTQPAAHGNHKH